MATAIAVVIIAVSVCRHEKPPGQELGQRPDLAQNSSPTASISDTFAIGFYNVENFFDLVDNGTEYPEFRPGALGWNKQMYDIKVDHIASVIAAMRLDAIGLCEVENRNALDGLRKEIRKRGIDYLYSAIADEPNRSVNYPALLSRFPITKSCGFSPPPGEHGRNILEADLDCGGALLRVYVNHWPAKAHPESERLAMAQALTQRIAGRGSTMPYIIIGDLNSDYDEWRTFRTRGFDDTKGITGLNNVLGTIRPDTAGGFTFVTKTDCCREGRPCHFDCWLDVPPEKRMSLTYRGLLETPDHILLPRTLLCGPTFTYCNSSFTAFTWNGLLMRGRETFGWQMRGFGRRRFHVGEGYSDHLPIYLRIVKGRGTPLRTPPSNPSKVDTSSASRQNTGSDLSDGEWLPTESNFTVTSEKSNAASSRYCLHVNGEAPAKNCTAARTVVRRPLLNHSRWNRVTFDIRGSGKIQLRMKSGHGKWRFYTGETFRYYRSSRFLLSRFPSWRHVAISFLADDLASPDFTIELRAGKCEPFSVYLDNFVIK